MISKIRHFLSRVSTFFHTLLIVGLQELGLVSVQDFLNQILFLKYKFMALHIALFSIGTGILVSVPFREFFNTWIYAPDMIFYMCMSTTISEWLTGVVKATKYDKEKFDLVKGVSILPKLISQAWALTTAFHFGTNEPLMAWFPPAVAIFLFTFNFLKTAYHLSKMGYFPDEFVEFLQDKFKMTNKTKPVAQDEEPNN